MKFSLQSVLFITLATVITAMIASLLMLGSTELWEVQSSDSVVSQVCGDAGPCVQITAGPIERLVVDHLDYDRDTVGDVIKRIPAWFGSQARPVGLTVHNVLLKEDVSLRDQGLSARTHISLVSLKEVRQD